MHLCMVSHIIHVEILCKFERKICRAIEYIMVWALSLLIALSSFCYLIKRCPRLRQLTPHPQPLEEVDGGDQGRTSARKIAAQDAETCRKLVQLA